MLNSLWPSIKARGFVLSFFSICTLELGPTASGRLSTFPSYKCPIFLILFPFHSLFTKLPAYPHHYNVTQKTEREVMRVSRWRKENIILFTWIIYINSNISPNLYYYRKEAKGVVREAGRKRRKNQKKREKKESPLCLPHPS